MAENEKITKKRKVIKSEGRKMIARVYHFLKDEYEFMKTFNHDFCDLSPLAKLISRTANATGVSEKTVTKILKEEKETNGNFVSPMDKRRKRTSKFDFDDFNIDIIRSTVENYHVDYKEEPTLKKLSLVLRDKVGFDGCLNSLKTLLFKLGYKIQTVDKKRVVQKIPQKKIKVSVKKEGNPHKEGPNSYREAPKLDEEEVQANEEGLNPCKVELIPEIKCEAVKKSELIVEIKSEVVQCTEVVKPH